MKKMIQVALVMCILQISAKKINEKSFFLKEKRFNPNTYPAAKQWQIWFCKFQRKGYHSLQIQKCGIFYRGLQAFELPQRIFTEIWNSSICFCKINGVDYRFDKNGKNAYLFKDDDLGKCQSKYLKQTYQAYIRNSKYGITESSKFNNPEDYRQQTIYPQYDYLHVLEGEDIENPMIIASSGNKFGVIDKKNKVIIPFEYLGIKPDFSWKLADLFEVTKDLKNYYFIDVKNNDY